MLSLFTNIAYAQASGSSADSLTFEQVWNNIITMIINPAIVILFMVAFVIFIWGVVEYMRGGEKSDERKKGSQHILWSVVGMTIMLGVFGIMSLIVKTFKFEAPPQTTDFNTQLNDAKAN